MTDVAPDFVLYCGSKGSIEQMTRVLAKDLGARGVTVNCIGPGPIVNIAARAAAANPRLPTPAMPASPPVLVSGSGCTGDFSGGDVAGCTGGGGPPINDGRPPSIEGRMLATDGARMLAADGARMLAADGARIRIGSLAGVRARWSVE